LNLLEHWNINLNPETDKNGGGAFNTVSPVAKDNVAIAGLLKRGNKDE